LIKHREFAPYDKAANAHNPSAVKFVLSVFTTLLPFPEGLFHRFHQPKTGRSLVLTRALGARGVSSSPSGCTQQEDYPIFGRRSKFIFS
jgi:hypothetical protein